MKNPLLFLLIVLLTFQQINADTGLPIIVMFEPLLIVLIIPIIFIEYIVMKKYLRDLESPKILRTAAISNIFSTIVGFPIAWVMMLVLQLTYDFTIKTLDKFFKFEHRWLFEILFTPAWMPPYEHPTKIQLWTMWLSIILMAVVSFLMSYWIEFKVVVKLLKESPTSDIKSAVFRANAMSYAFLVMATVCLPYVHREYFCECINWMLYKVFELAYR